MKIPEALYVLYCHKFVNVLFTLFKKFIPEAEAKAVLPF